MLRIRLDSTTATKEEGGVKFCCPTFLCSLKFYKIENYFIFEQAKKIIWEKFTKNYSTFYPKNYQKYGFWIRDKRSESEKNLSRIQGSKTNRIPIESGSATQVTTAPIFLIRKVSYHPIHIPMFSQKNLTWRRIRIPINPLSKLPNDDNV